MSNSGDAAGSKGSASPSTNPPRADQGSPLRRSGGDNSPAPTPRGRGSSPRRPPSTPVSGATPTSRPPTTPTVSGATPTSRPSSTPGSGTPASKPPTTPGSGSTPASRPSLPHWLTSSPGASGGASGSGGHGIVGAQAVPVGGLGGSMTAPAALGGGSLIGRKRAREADVAGGRGGEGGVAGDHPCSVCGRTYASLKALFGHMRKHPDRGWKGVHPPPAFKAEEEFADIRAEVAGADRQVAAAADPVEAVPAEGDGGEPSNYRVPDLNHSPPPDK